VIKTGLDFKEYKTIHKECYDLSVKKNNDYGCNSLIKYGNKGMLIRVSDKIDRLDNLIWEQKDQKVSDEKVEDTLKDIINYCTYMLMQSRGKLEDVSL